VQVDRIQFTTKAKYTIGRPDNQKPIFSAFLEDPHPELPEELPEGLERMPDLGEYVLVKADSITDLQRTKV
jgi:hypothetical protein